MKRANTKTEKHDLSRHNLGKISAQELKKEAKIASMNLAQALRERASGNYSAAIDLYFKCAGIGTNVVCTARIHKVKVPKKLILETKEEVETSIEGLKDCLREATGLKGVTKEKGLATARTKLRNAEKARVKGDLRLAVSRALTAAVTAARASRGKDAESIIQGARIIIQDAAIQRLLRRRA